MRASINRLRKNYPMVSPVVRKEIDSRIMLAFPVQPAQSGDYAGSDESEENACLEGFEPPTF